jgi:hypothetical protein
MAYFLFCTGILQLQGIMILGRIGAGRPGQEEVISPDNRGKKINPIFVKKKYQCSSLWLVIGIMLCSCGKSSQKPAAINTQPPGTLKYKLAYIYDKDSADGVDFKALMKDNDCAVTLIDKSKVDDMDYTPYNLIVIGNNTASGTSNTILKTGWTAEDSAAISHSSKPVVFMGIGGIMLTVQMGNQVNCGNCSANPEVSFGVADTSSLLYAQPKKIVVPDDGVLGICTQPALCYEYHTPALPVVPGATFVGKVSINWKDDYPLWIENARTGQLRYGAFTFCTTITNLTATGKDFLVNFLYYTGQFGN